MVEHPVEPVFAAYPIALAGQLYPAFLHVHYAWGWGCGSDEVGSPQKKTAQGHPDTLRASAASSAHHFALHYLLRESQLM